jgi:hypothetical protein
MACQDCRPISAGAPRQGCVKAASYRPYAAVAVDSAAVMGKYRVLAAPEKRDYPAVSAG